MIRGKNSVVYRVVPSYDGILSPIDASDIVTRMGVNDSLIYYVGNLARERSARRLPGKLTERAYRLNMLADYMLRQVSGKEFSFGDGSVVKGMATGHLFKRRVPDADDIYEYLFIKTGPGRA